MFSARMLGVSPSLPLKLVSSSLPVTNMAQGSGYTCIVTISGGVAPYKYELVKQGVVWQSKTNQTALTIGFTVTGDTSYNGQSLLIRVTDATNNIINTGSVSMYSYIPDSAPSGASASPSSYSVPVGSSITCYASVNGVPAPSITWHYYNPNSTVGGVFGSGYTVSSGTFAAGDSGMQFWFVATNYLGSTTSNTFSISVY